jgi:hypothetical protein
MKQLLSLAILASLLPVTLLSDSPSLIRKKPNPTPQPLIVQEVSIDDDEDEKEEDDDLDAKVALATVASMAEAIGFISTDPYNPMVLGPGIAKISISVINMITQMFKSLTHDQEITREHVEQYFDKLPEETKLQLIKFVILFADLYRKGSIAASCPEHVQLHRPAREQ